jgi:outer membrane protein OmpA-like peptidoglycan-associated protein
MAFLSTIISIAFAVLVMISTTVYSQERPSYGVYGAYTINLHNADFRAFPGVPSCCPRYEDGNGSGLLFGVLYQLPLTTDLRLSLRGSYSGLNGTLERNETGLMSGGVNGNFVHQAVVNISDIGIEPMVQYSPLQSLWVSAGMRAGLLMSKTFSQKEQVTTDGFLFTNGRTTRNEVTNETIAQTSSLLASAVMAVSYDLPLNKKGTMIAAPEVSYTVPFTTMVQGIDWKISQLRLGVAIKWSPLPEFEPIRRNEERKLYDTVKIQVAEPQLAGFIKGKEIQESTTKETDGEIVTTTIFRRTDTLRTAKPNSLEANVTAVGVYPDGKELPVFKIQVEEFTSVLMTPLLPYIFFDEGSAELPQRYDRITESARTSFNEKSVNSADRLKTYYQVLNIIGYRMLQYLKATLTLTGCNTDIGTEKGNTTLSQNRANAVKQYLVSEWGIAESRIKTETRNLPAKSANTLTTDGAQENRRVEIVSTVPEITAPIITDDILRTVSPAVVRFRNTTKHDNEIQTWNLKATQDSKQLTSYNGKSKTPEQIDWNVNSEISTQPLGSQSVSYTLTVSDVNGKTVESSNTIPVEQITVRKKKAERIADKEIQRFSLILFDVRSSEITATNKSIIGIIKPYITATSTVSIVGYTDRLGEAQQNQKLAEERAKITAKELGVNPTMSSVSAVANSEKYAPELPEGRLYTRTVDIIIETLINK